MINIKLDKEQELAAKAKLLIPDTNITTPTIIDNTR